MKNTQWFACGLLAIIAWVAGCYDGREHPLKWEEIVAITEEPFIALNAGDVDKSLSLFHRYEDFLENNPESSRTNRLVGLWQCYLFLSRIYLSRGDTDRYKDYMQKSVFYFKEDPVFYRQMLERIPDAADDVDRNNAIFDIMLTDKKLRGHIDAALADKLLEAEKPALPTKNTQTGE